MRLGSALSVKFQIKLDSLSVVPTYKQNYERTYDAVISDNLSCVYVGINNCVTVKVDS